MQLIPNASKAWRMFSVQAMALSTAILTTWPTIPDDLKSHIPTAWVHYLCAALLVLGIAGRLIQQASLTPQPVESDPTPPQPKE